MNDNLNNIPAQTPPSKQALTMAQYVERRNGVPLGDNQSLKNMLERSFGASSFAGFWQYWNPIWGYGLGKYVYAPMQRIMPAAVAVIMTFVVSGLLHDLVTMAVRGAVTFFFTPWFFILGVGVVLGRAVGMDLSGRSFWLRVAINFAYLVIGAALTVWAKGILGVP